MISNKLDCFQTLIFRQEPDGNSVLNDRNGNVPTQGKFNFQMFDKGM